MKSFTVLIVIGFAAAFGLAWFGSSVRAADPARIPLDTQCADPAGAKERLSALEGLKMLPDIRLGNSNGYVVHWMQNGEVFGFVVVGGCAVVKVFWMGNYRPATNV